MSTHGDWQEAVWRQFGAAIDMVERAIGACPEVLWTEQGRGAEFWRLAYHTLFWLDCYLADDPAGYHPPTPFILDEMNPDAVPERTYTPAELLDYLRYARANCRARVAGMTAEAVGAPSPVTRLGVTAGELLIYNLRHVQHGAAQLNLLIRQATSEPSPMWVRRTEGPL